MEVLYFGLQFRQIYHSDKHVLGKCLGLSWSKVFINEKDITKKSTSLFKHLRALSLKIKEKKERKKVKFKIFFVKKPLLKEEMKQW